MTSPKQNSIREEASALGERASGAAKEFAGEVTGNESLEQRGELEREEGRSRQDANQVTNRAAGTGPYVTSLYREPAAAERAYGDLRSKNYNADDIDVVMSDETRRTHFKDSEVGTKAAEGLGVGSAVGGGVGATLAAIFAVGTSVAIPGLGLVVAGPIAAALAGAGAGAATGGLIGAMVGAGIPEDRAKAYEQGLREGGVVIGTRARDHDHARELERDMGTSGGTGMLGLH